MVTKWTVHSFDEAPLEIIDGDRGKNYPKQTDFFDTGHCLFLNAGNVTATGFNLSSCSFITQEKDHVLRKGKLVRKDIVLTTRGTVGNVAFYDDSIPYEHVRINSGMVIFRANTKAILPRFLYLYLRSGILKRQVLSLTTGSAQPQLPIRDIKRVIIPLPPLPEQHTIAHILGALDDKIELNRQINHTLEAIARAIFKSWFVDFDPVWAKAEGRTPAGMDAETAALFPAAFVESELGLIPEGWRVGTVGEIAKNQRRGIQPEDIAPDTPYIGLQHMPQKSITLSDWGEAQEVSSTKFSFAKGEILFGKLRPYFHKVGVAPLDGVCSTDILVVVPKSQEWFGLVLCYFSSDEFVDYTTAVSTGTRMPRTNWRDMSRYKILVPPHNLAEAFNLQIVSLTDAIRNNLFQSHTLAELRDTLLPRLISGQLRVPDAEKLVGEIQ